MKKNYIKKSVLLCGMISFFGVLCASELLLWHEKHAEQFLTDMIVNIAQKCRGKYFYKIAATSKEW